MKKNANTTTVILLREMETGIVDKGGFAKDTTPNILSMPAMSLFKIRRSFIFVVIRDPYTRVLSAFLEKFKQESYRAEFGEFPLSRDGFAQFVAWLAAGGLARDGHWDLQTKQILLPLAKYDAVIRFENFGTEMRKMFERNGLSPPAGRLDGLYESDVGKKTSASTRLTEFYTRDVAATIAHLYRTDFDVLGYSREFPV